MIDIHMIQLEGANLDWRKQAIASVGADADIHIVQGVPGFREYQQLRLESMLIGDQPYSTYVDEDDWLEVGALRRLRKVISATKPRFGFVSLEQVWDYFTRTVYIMRRHHLLVVHKDHVKRMLDAGPLPDNPERALAMHPATVAVDAVLYNWRRYPSAAFAHRVELGEEDTRKAAGDVDVNIPLTMFKPRTYRGRIDPAV